MKRICVLIPAICLLLCACGRGETIRPDRLPEWPFSMTSVLTMEMPENGFTADWIYKEGQSAFTLKTPQELSGVTIFCNAVESRIEKDDVQIDLPQQSAFVLLDRAYRALTDGLVEPRRTQEGWLYDGMDRYGFEALCDADGSLHIRFPKVDAEASFTVVPIEENAE